MFWNNRPFLGKTSLSKAFVSSAKNTDSRQKKKIKTKIFMKIECSSIVFFYGLGCFLETLPANAFTGLARLRRLRIVSPSPAVGVRIGAMNGIENLRYLEVR